MSESNKASRSLRPRAKVGYFQRNMKIMIFQLKRPEFYSSAGEALAAGASVSKRSKKSKEPIQVDSDSESEETPSRKRSGGYQITRFYKKFKKSLIFYLLKVLEHVKKIQPEDFRVSAKQVL